MSQWMQSLVGYMLIVSVVMQLLPSKKYEKYVRLFTGFLLLILVFRPLLKINSASSFLEHKISELIEEQEILEQKIGEEAAEFQNESGQGSQWMSEETEVVLIEPVEVKIDD